MSYLRVYRHLEIPGPHKLETVYTGPRLRTLIRCVTIGYQIPKVWKSLGLPLKSSIVPSNSWTGVRWIPGVLSLGTFRASGPNGILLIGRIVDMIKVADSNVLYLCHYFSRLLNQCFKSRNQYGPLDLFRWLETEKILKLKDLSPFKEKANNGLLRRIAFFIDGAGK